MTTAREQYYLFPSYCTADNTYSNHAIVQHPSPHCLKATKYSTHPDNFYSKIEEGQSQRQQQRQDAADADSSLTSTIIASMLCLLVLVLLVVAASFPASTYYKYRYPGDDHDTGSLVYLVPSPKEYPYTPYNPHNN